MGGGLPNLLQYYSFERKMEGHNPFSSLHHWSWKSTMSCRTRQPTAPKDRLVIFRQKRRRKWRNSWLRTQGGAGGSLVLNYHSDCRRSRQRHEVWCCWLLRKNILLLWMTGKPVHEIVLLMGQILNWKGSVYFCVRCTSSLVGLTFSFTPKSSLDGQLGTCMKYSIAVS